ncbi:MAG: hypothetical protein QOH63_1747 [Acidobacteriota bacterium]|jgi:hypothetical protein|nr:hypothetical protein [Acidobacteriota bacterium]
MQYSPQPINVEEQFNEFVREFGGELVSKLLPKNTDIPLNADYLFRKEGVIAELKCLEKNDYGSKELEKKFNKIHSKWLHDGLVKLGQINTRAIDISSLPLKCQNDLFKLVGRQIITHIDKANDQIKETKKFLGLPDAKGLLLLVNDGNYLLEHHDALRFLARRLKPAYTSIDKFVYLTVNLRAISPEGVAVRVWLDAHSRENVNEISDDFTNSLRKGWLSFLRRRVGEDFEESELPSFESIEGLKLIKKLANN